ncbi:phosphatase inhibitor-domain-containing protein [Rhodocollybia butyracea]|uniref:Type 1 phosphatases regulator n=1 Tax=Rhodocollybia butyracea TaxID=206335 RepID=A0A9P5PS25_9AGAR|nr:phosphatase inhibitor-domain-containing protein [Rhodocollybia butyracea]
MALELSRSPQPLQPKTSPKSTAPAEHAFTKKPRKSVLWREDVVDNEGAGKKSSKICCIYHQPKAFDESSDEVPTRIWTPLLVLILRMRRVVTIIEPSCRLMVYFRICGFFQERV